MPAPVNIAWQHMSTQIWAQTLHRIMQVHRRNQPCQFCGEHTERKSSLSGILQKWCQKQLDSSCSRHLCLHKKTDRRGFPWLAPECSQAPHPWKPIDTAAQVSNGKPHKNVYNWKVKTVYTLKRDIHLFGMSSIIFHVPDKVIKEGITLRFKLQVWAFF